MAESGDGHAIGGAIWMSNTTLRSIIAEQIMRDKASPVKTTVRNIARRRCLICGELLAELTHVHAEKHGLTKQDMVKRGLVEYFNGRQRKGGVNKAVKGGSQIIN